MSKLSVRTRGCVIQVYRILVVVIRIPEDLSGMKNHRFQYEALALDLEEVQLITVALQ